MSSASAASAPWLAPAPSAQPDDASRPILLVEPPGVLPMFPLPLVPDGSFIGSSVTLPESTQLPAAQVWPCGHRSASSSVRPSQPSSKKLHFSGTGSPGMQYCMSQPGDSRRHQPSPQVGRTRSSMSPSQSSSTLLQISSASACTVLSIGLQSPGSAAQFLKAPAQPIFGVPTFSVRTSYQPSSSKSGHSSTG